MNQRHRRTLFLFLFLFFSLVSVSRRIDSITNPQFWAEDGAAWYADAYRLGPFQPFLIPASGYFQSVSRLGAAISLLVPLAYAPLVFNLIAIGFQVLPIIFFLSRRFAHLIPSFTMRVVIGLVYLGLPSVFETHINLSNVQWRLALLLFLIIIARRDDRLGWRIFDGFFITLAGLSGPFSIVAFPIALYYFHVTHPKRPRWQLVALGSTAVVQLASAVFQVWHQARGAVVLGASVGGFFQIVAGKIFISGIFGWTVYRSIWQTAWWLSGLPAFVIGVGGLFLLAYVFRQSRLEMRLFLVYCYSVFALALLFPMVSAGAGVPEWSSMLRPNGGNRYYLLPMLAWIAAIGWLYLESPRHSFRRRAALVLLVGFVVIGVPLDWRIKSFKDYHFQEQTQAFDRLAPGEVWHGRINPDWDMELHKH